MSTPISAHVQVTIAIDSVSIARASFGIPMVLAYIAASIMSERVRSYDSADALTAMRADGFPTSHPAYRMVQALLAQNPKVEKVKLGRCRAHTQDTELEVLSAVEGQTIAVTIIDELGVPHVISRPVGAASSLSNEATALAALINAALTNLTATASGTDGNIQCVADNPGDVFYFHSWTNLNVTDETPDPGLAADLADIVLEDDDWYAAILDVNSFALADALATWVETQRKIAVVQSQDSEIPTSGAGDIATELSDDERDRTALIYTHKQSLSEYPAPAWVGRCLPKDPGALTWAFKRASGVSPSKLTATERGHLEAKHANHYITIAGANITRHGEMASGMWIDRQQLVDWLQARVEESLFDLMVSNDKLPFTDDTVSMAEAAIYGVYKQGAENSGLVLGDFSFSAPKASAQTTADRAARLMRGIKFGGTFTDAVHKLSVTGQIS